MIEVVNVEHKTVLEGKTRVTIDTDDELYHTSRRKPHPSGRG